ncbi:hypothetical protein OAN24_00775 [Pseudodesulfovibrio sp.]|nr:hypothetical protein [Pseudodesulfovibrio sp.]
MNKVACLTVKMKVRARTAWNSLMQKGFHLYGQSGMSVRQFLVEVVGYDNPLIDESVRTIFLNSSPVDDLDAVHLKDGDRLALGSAMPGLVGIVMGRDNPYKEFRSGIACQGNDADLIPENTIRVFIKVFSTLAVDTGEAILNRGIHVNGEVLTELLNEQKEHLINDDVLSGFSLDTNGDVRITVEFTE